jgi:hypothetical protein
MLSRPSLLWRPDVALILLIYAGADSTGCVLRLHADEAIRPDGSVIAGTLQQQGENQLVFKTQGRNYSLDDLARVRLSSKTASFFHPPHPRVIHLAGGQWITANFIALDESLLLVEPAWGGLVRLPRRAVYGICHLAGLVPVIEEDFESESSRWKFKTTAQATREHHCSGKQGLIIRSPEQNATLDLNGLDAGLVEAAFHDDAAAGGCPWALQLHWRLATEKETITFGPSLDAKAYRVDAGKRPGLTNDLPRVAGWHHLFAEFGKSSMVVGVDDLVLFRSFGPLPSGGLCQIQLVAMPPRSPGRLAAVIWDDVRVCRRVSLDPQPALNQRHDEVWTSRGDQWFGHVAGADQEKIEFSSVGKKYRLAWEEVRGVFFHVQPGMMDTARTRNCVHVGFRSGIRSNVDQLDGTVEALGDRVLKLRHSALGPVSIGRDRLIWLEAGTRFQQAK